MNGYDQQLKELLAQCARKRKLEASAAELRRQRDTYAARAEELKEAMREEQADVDRLEGRSLAAFFYNVVGKMDEKLTQERQEAYAARVRYDAAARELAGAEEDLARCQAELEELGDRIDYTRVSLDQESASLPDGMKLDLGAVAKGYTADRLAKLAQERDITSALLDLGQSTILALGAKPDGSPWRIGIQDPQGEGYLGVLELEGQAMGTSGGYQRYYTAPDGTVYQHILDPKTGYPVESDLLSVSILCDNGTMADAYSTALYVMGSAGAQAFWRTHGGFEMILITTAGQVLYTPGLSEKITPTEGSGYEYVSILP